MRRLPSPTRIARALTDEGERMLDALPDRVHTLPFRLQARMALSRGTIWYKVCVPPRGWALTREPWTITPLGQKIITAMHARPAVRRALSADQAKSA